MHRSPNIIIHNAIIMDKLIQKNPILNPKIKKQSNPSRKQIKMEIQQHCKKDKLNIKSKYTIECLAWSRVYIEYKN